MGYLPRIWQTEVHVKRPITCLFPRFPHFFKCRASNSKWKNKYLQIKGFISLQMFLEIKCHFNHMLVYFSGHIVFACVRSPQGEEAPHASWGSLTIHTHLCEGGTPGIRKCVSHPTNWCSPVETFKPGLPRG